MIRIEHNTKQVERAFRKAPQVMLRRVDRALERGRLELGRHARSVEAPIARSELVRSIGGRRLALGRHILEVKSQHGAPVERGTGPGGLPSLAAMTDWIQVRGIQPRDPDDDIEDLARRIRMSILRNGTPANPYMQRSVNRLRSRIIAGVVRANEAGAREVFGKSS